MANALANIGLYTCSRHRALTIHLLICWLICMSWQSGGSTVHDCDEQGMDQRLMKGSPEQLCVLQSVSEQIENLSQSSVLRGVAQRPDDTHTNVHTHIEDAPSPTSRNFPTRTAVSQSVGQAVETSRVIRFQSKCLNSLISAASSTGFYLMKP